MSKATSPTYKTTNLADYNAALKRRGSLTIWFDPETNWDAKPSGNPVFIIDEIEKAGHATSSNGRSYDLSSALLPLLETQSSQAWQCPYFQVPFDVSWISWILTSNDTAPLSAPLRSRVQIIDLPALTSGQLMTFMERDAARRGLSDLSVGVALTVIAGACTTSRDGPSLRTALRVLDRAQALETRPRLHWAKQTGMMRQVWSTPRLLCRWLSWIDRRFVAARCRAVEGWLLAVDR